MISIHALLAESDLYQILLLCGRLISIHALLAESDLAGPSGPAFLYNFYPRSPCGERPRKSQSSGAGIRISIHALLAESDVTVLGIQHKVGISIHALLAESDGRISDAVNLTEYFYPRSPCGERHVAAPLHRRREQFLSTLSLRRATHPAPAD